MVQVTIIGMGLIGTSLGLALRTPDAKTSPLGDITVVGYDRDARATADARGRLAIDREARTLQDALRGANLVVLAVPVQALRDLFAQMIPLLAQGMVITDVSSTKTLVMDWAHSLLPPSVDFVGGHPMAGSEQSGARAASPDLFKDAIYCLTPTPQTRPEALDLVNAMVKQIGAKPYYIDPAEHDSYVAAVSHLPFLLSAVLVEATTRSPSWKEMRPLAATGFRDISRLASGDVEMHRDICMTNREAITRWIDETVQHLLDVRDSLGAGDQEKLEDLFSHARAAREDWLESRPNMRPGEADFEDTSGYQIERPSLLGRLGRPPRSDKRR